MPKTNKLLFITLLIGIISIFIGINEITSAFKGLSTALDPSSPSISTWELSKISLILCEVLIDIVWIVLIGILICFVGKGKKMLTLSAGLFRGVLLALMLILNWDPGWYFILDPNGYHKITILMIIFGGIQSGLLMITSVFKEEK